MVEKEATKGKDNPYKGIENFAWKANELADYQIQEEEGPSYLATYHLESGDFLEVKHKVYQGKKLIFVSRIDFDIKKGVPTMSFDTYLTAFDISPDGKLDIEGYEFAYDSLDVDLEKRTCKCKKLAEGESKLRGLDIEHLLREGVLKDAKKMDKPIDFLALLSTLKSIDEKELI